MKKIILITLILSIFTSCGSDGSLYDDSVENQLSLKLIINRSEDAGRGQGYAEIMKYRITVDGDGLDSPLVSDYGSDSESALIENIPAGGEKRITVEAINNDNQVILRGESFSVKVVPGQVSEVEIEMLSVPIFVGLKNDLSIPSNRLVLKIYSSDESVLEIEDEYENSKNLMINPSTNSTTMSVSSANGLLFISPKSVKEGGHRFTVRSQSSGYSSSIDLKILKKINLNSVSLFSGGYVGVSGYYLKTGRLGAFSHPSHDNGLLWSAVLDSIFLER